MKMRTIAILPSVVFLATPGAAESVLFDFDNGPLRAPLPISLTVGGITAQFSATGQGFSIQEASTMGFTPAGFSGYCIYPTSVFAADLLVRFSQTITNFSILYAPEEYACDSSARMRVTAYMDNTLTGTATTTADPPGTWPSATLAFSSAQGFNNVVVHYDAPPPTGGDYGSIFMVDNMSVTTAPAPIVLSHTEKLANGAFQFTFNGTPGLGFSVLSTTNLAVPFSHWTVLGTASEISPGQFQYTDLEATNRPESFYRVRSP